jgi:hypothetical protein
MNKITRNFDPLKPEVRAEWEELTQTKTEHGEYMAYLMFQLDSAIHNIKHHINNPTHGKINDLRG